MCECAQEKKQLAIICFCIAARLSYLLAAFKNLKGQKGQKKQAHKHGAPVCQISSWSGVGLEQGLTGHKPPVLLSSPLEKHH